MKYRFLAPVAGFLLTATAPPAAPDAAALFGAREGVEDISLSPGGTRIAFLAPDKGQGSILFSVDLAGDRLPKRVTAASGSPERLRSCGWVSDERLVCTVYGITDIDGRKVPFSRLVAIDHDGRNLKLVSLRDSSSALGFSLGGGNVIDWLPGDDGAILVGRSYIPENSTGTHLAQTADGYGVDRIDTRTLKSNGVEPPRRTAIEYISDGRGTVRVMGLRQVRGSTGQDTGIISYLYRAKGSTSWRELGALDTANDEGFNPYAVDSTCDCAYGFRKTDGRSSLVRVTLATGLAEEQILTRPDVDIDNLVRLGRTQRVVGASFATERREVVYFDPVLQKLAVSLSKALPGLPLVRFQGASLDESKLLIWAGSDTDPGRYFVYDKASRRLDEIMLSRPDLEGVTLAVVKPVQYAAADGTMIPAYLTLPPGSYGKKLPAIVMPHGGPGARDEWGFDWLAQFYANRGYAVLQPNFRGSTGYGDSWFRDNGFRSWRTAIGDVDDGGRWLVSSGTADPAKLAIVGWSYGGYAALQSGVLDPGLFKAIVAVAPVTDLDQLKAERRDWSDYGLVARYVGSGPHIREGSPAQNAAKIVAPVLIFHGNKDANVDVAQGQLMASRLKAARKPVDLVVFPGLDHQLEDAAARRDMLARSDMFLRKALGL